VEPAAVVGGPTEETTMNPATCYDLAQARIADLRRQAQRDGLAHAVRRSRQPPAQQGRHPKPGLRGAARRVLTVLGARSP
jgi:hypothetical protein